MEKFQKNLKSVERNLKNNEGNIRFAWKETEELGNFLNNLNKFQSRCLWKYIRNVKEIMGKFRGNSMAESWKICNVNFTDFWEC